MPASKRKREQLALTALTIEAEAKAKEVYITRAKGSAHGVSLHILCNPEQLHPLDTAEEAAEVFDALLELPAETRRALQLLIHENADTFAGLPFAKYTPVHPHPSRRGGR